jgi:hypothetical protein
MKMRDSIIIQEQVKEQNISFLGEIAFDPDLEAAIGDVDKLRTTKFMNTVEEILSKHPEITKH